MTTTLRRLAVVALVGLVMLAPLSVQADTKVDPNRRNTSVRLEADRSERPSHRNVQAHHSGKWEKPPVYAPCRVDPETGLYGCRTYRPRDADGAELTEGDILRAVREIGLPSLQVQIQPGSSTLVNVPTIFYTEPQAFNRSITLLGFDIDLVATPVRYRWLHGDGTDSTTRKPGKPYPSTEVTHRYRQPADALAPRVDVTYRVRYRVDGGAWNTIDQTLLASGPTATLEVKEAAPVLTHP